MQDLWRLSAADLASLIRSKKVSAKEAATAALARLDAVNPEDQRRGRPRRPRCWRRRQPSTRRSARGEDAGPLAGVPVTVKVNIDQEGFATTNGLKLQREVIAQEQQPGDRQSAQGRRRHSRPHQLPGVFLSLVHHQSDPWRHQKPARSRHHAGRLVRRRGRCGRGRHRPHRARHRYRGLDPLSRLCLRRARPAADGRPRRGVQCGAAGAPHRHPRCAAVSGPLARTIGDLRIALAAMSGRDVRDPWWVPAPLEGPAMPKRVAHVPQSRWTRSRAGSEGRGRGCRQTARTRRLDGGGDSNTPPLREAADLKTKLWLGDGYEAQLAMAEREGDPGALACLRGNRTKVFPFDGAFQGPDAPIDVVARMAGVFREIPGAADAGVRRIAVPRSTRSQGRGILCPGLACPDAADRAFPSWACRG